MDGKVSKLRLLTCISLKVMTTRSRTLFYGILGNTQWKMVLVWVSYDIFLKDNKVITK